MRYFEIASCIRIPVDEEEQDLLDAYTEIGNILDEDLNERGQEVARKMVSRGLLNTIELDGKLYYQANGLQDITRI